jgi:hypothetical protein
MERKRFIPDTDVTYKQLKDETRISLESSLCNFADFKFSQQSIRQSQTSPQKNESPLIMTGEDIGFRLESSLIRTKKQLKKKLLKPKLYIHA